MKYCLFGKESWNLPVPHSEQGTAKPLSFPSKKMNKNKNKNENKDKNKKN